MIQDSLKPFQVFIASYVFIKIPTSHDKS